MKKLTVREIKRALNEPPESSDISSDIDDLPIVIAGGGQVVTAVEIVYQQAMDGKHEPVAVMLRVVPA